jgi:hypothetical protein
VRDRDRTNWDFFWKKISDFFGDLTRSCSQRLGGTKKAKGVSSRPHHVCWAAAGAIAREYGPPTTIYNRFVRWARRGVWENLFRELAGQGRAADAQRDHGCSRHNESA